MMWFVDLNSLNEVIIVFASVLLLNTNIDNLHYKLK
jgi:hypothetical protein